MEYHRVLAGEKRRIGRGVLAIVLLLAGLVVFPTVIGRAAAIIDVRLGNTPPILPGGTDYTPLYNAASMFSLALLIPWSMCIQRWLYGVRGASLHSVVSRFRFDVFGRALLVFGPVLVFVHVIGVLFTPAQETGWSQGDLVGVLLGVLLLTPLQAAGEEYGVRGLMFRVLGSWARGARAGLVVGVLVSAVLFTALHGSSDPYIILWYLVWWSGLALITWRTGGLEVAVVVVVHALINTVSLAMAPLMRADLAAELGDRSAGAVNAYQLVPTLTVVAITAAVWWCTRHSGPARAPGPRPIGSSTPPGPVPAR
ncbi:abortive phage infection protein [Pseudonocardia sp. EC080610-09]|uniref:CPBP family intramembrane glutamic endopeptidase n=1 Tax=unclassified Pseudonocardia TaxID=2619320 RepID=UPI0007063969|nr:MULTISPECIES: type II CAAX endopeptidase family protein [unclassified Pseudonocardia]ALL75887.1 abortive phage infection protein [Pseudonocardia sp. EC080610-09]ALL82914.1 abortive phage infection protein [Pseudonocardia sp. EC080619-01]